MYGWVLYIAAVVYPVGPTAYYYQPVEVKRQVDYHTAEECFRAQSNVYENVFRDSRLLNGGWITSAQCIRVDIEPN